MFVIMFEFVVKPGKEDAFMATWANTTQGIYVHKGSLGSRLHRDQNGAFVAYAQWPDRATWQAAEAISMSPEYEAERSKMRECLDLDATKVLHEMDVTVDYLQRRPFEV